MLDLMARFDRPGYSLFPGPLSASEPLYTIAVQDIVEYSYASIGAAILAFPGCREIRPAEPDWSQWQAEWRQDGRWLRLDMAPEEDHLISPETGQSIWSGSHLVCDCLIGNVIALWVAVRRTHPGVWLCDGARYGEIGSRLFSPESFVAMPYLA